MSFRIGYNYQKAKLDIYALGDLEEVVRNYIRQAAEEGDLDELIEVRLGDMDENDLRKVREAITAHIEDGAFDDAVTNRALKLGFKEAED